MRLTIGPEANELASGIKAHVAGQGDVGGELLSLLGQDFLLRGRTEGIPAKPRAAPAAGEAQQQGQSPSYARPIRAEPEQLSKFGQAFHLLPPTDLLENHRQREKS